MRNFINLRTTCYCLWKGETQYLRVSKNYFIESFSRIPTSPLPPPHQTHTPAPQPSVPSRDVIHMESPRSRLLLTISDILRHFYSPHIRNLSKWAFPRVAFDFHFFSMRSHNFRNGYPLTRFRSAYLARLSPGGDVKLLICHYPNNTIHRRRCFLEARETLKLYHIMDR